MSLPAFPGSVTTWLFALFLAAYGLLYGRLDVEVVRQPIRLARLPKAFEGFRIAQLSDLHISPFTTAEHIRHCVMITNALKPDLIAMTGDYISWDPEAEGDVVSALAGLRAPFGVFGCLGNHEEESGTEDSITRLFAREGVRCDRPPCTGPSERQDPPVVHRGDMRCRFLFERSLSSSQEVLLNQRLIFASSASF